MPDRDIVHPKVAIHFQAAYRQLCEWRQPQLLQADNLRLLLATSKPWEELAREYPVLCDIADQVSVRAQLPVEAVQHRLLRLYSGYASEWDQVRGILSEGLL